MKGNLSIRVISATLILLCLMPGACAETACFSRDDNLGKPRTDIEEGRSATLTAPLILWGDSADCGSTASRSVVSRSGSSCDSSTQCRPVNSGDSQEACRSAITRPGNSCDQAAQCQPVDCGNQPACNPAPTQRPAQNPSTAPAKAPGGDTAGSHYTPASLSSQERYLLDAINTERLNNGRTPLAADSVLSELAREKSADMVNNKYFAHESPTDGRAADVLKREGYTYASVAENIARSGSVEKAHAALMSSDGHRRNILGSQWTKMGIGVVNDANGYPYVTEWFVR
ncbi:MAG: CAP domain-containing protein [Firmicutes bacterium]|nr:CAP domain-containing protein [Bacillota bacterium]